MGITVQRITQNFDVITDLQCLEKITNVSNQLAQLQEQDTDGMTEAEMSRVKAAVKKTKTRLTQLIKEADDKTITLTLVGLASSPWNAIVVVNTKTQDGRIVRDYNGMLAEAVPRMLVKTVWKSKPQEDISWGDGELAAFIESLTDTQTSKLLQTIQTLNTPIDEVPKEARDLIS